MNESLHVSELSTELFHVSDRSYVPGDIKPAGTYGNSLINEGICSQDSDPLGEHLREAIRASAYPSKPRRLKSSFVFETFDDAFKYRELTQKKGPIYKVKFVDSKAVAHRICWSVFNTDSGIPLDMQAHDFWKNPKVYGTNSEIFAESSIEILEECAPALP